MAHKRKTLLERDPGLFSPERLRWSAKRNAARWAEADRIAFGAVAEVWSAPARPELAKPKARKLTRAERRFIAQCAKDDRECAAAMFEAWDALLDGCEKDNR